MQEISREDSKQIMLKILRDVADFCDNNNLVYYLAYGTLIGAIRHKGFIPWDDDIDIMMPRPDYEEFVRLYHKKGRYGISSPLVDDGCFLVYSKVYDQRTIKYESGVDYKRYPALGVDIDVFPLDGIPQGKHYNKYLKECRLFLKYSECISRVISPRKKHYSVKGWIASKTINPILRLIGKDFFIKKSIDLMIKYRFEESDFLHVAFPLESSLNECFEKKDFKKRIKLCFEEGFFWAPEGYDAILKNSYGDYMKLPPIEERRTHHINTVYWKE